jgi:DNA modification methylase
LQEFPDMMKLREIVVDETMTVIGGNMRVLALRKMGIQEAIAKIVKGLTADQKREFVIKDNATFGEWDMDALANGWSDLPLGDWGVDLPDEWTDGDGDEPQDAEPQIDKAAELNKVWQVKRGDLWRIGEHRLLCGDSTKKEDVGRVMGGEKADMVIADPPYGINIVAANGYVGGGEAYNIPFGGIKKGDVGGGAAHIRKTGKSYLQEWNDKKRFGTSHGAKPFGSKKVRGSVGAANVVDAGKYAPIIGDDTTETAIRSAHLHLELFPDAKQFWFGANHYANVLPPFSCWVVWDKEATGNFSDCELAWSNQAKAARLFRHKWNGMLRDSERERRLHPSQKPAALASWIYTEFGAEGDIVIDPFGGAGWTIVAAENTKRKARVIEMSEDYIAVILQRMTDAFPGIKIERIGK